jgi:hypothetical protein
MARQGGTPEASGTHGQRQADAKRLLPKDELAVYTTATATDGAAARQRRRSVNSGLVPNTPAMGATEVLAGASQDDIRHPLPDHVVMGIDGTAAALGFMPAFVLDDLGDVGKLAVDKLGFAAHGKSPGCSAAA